MNFAKAAFDVGLFSNDIEPLIEFYRDELGLTYDELLKVGGGVHQHRIRVGESILKLNSVRDPLPDEPAGPITELCILGPELESERELTDPAGNRVRLCPAPTAALGATLTGPEPEAVLAAYAHVLDFSAVDASSVACGDSVLTIQSGPARPAVAMRAPGLRYLTIQITDVAGSHAHAVSQGFDEIEAPRTLGSVASISFVRDGFGTPIELSQRASLTGDLTIKPS